MPQSLSELIKLYLHHLNTNGAVGTMNNYRVYLTRFLTITRARMPEDVSLQTIHQFQEVLRRTYTSRGSLMNLSTISYHLVALRSFLAFIQQQHITTMDPHQIALPHIPSAQKASLTPKQLEALRTAPRTRARTPLTALRDEAILELILSTGLKVSEISALTRGQVSADRRVLQVRGLRNATRLITISFQARHLINQYLEKRTDASPALFVRHDKASDAHPAALTPRSIQRMIHAYAKSVALPSEITPETLRQYYARHLADRGENTDTIRERLGHARVATTKRYLHN